MTLPKEEAEALRRCLSILAPLHPAHERRTMALNIEQRIRGKSTALLCMRFTQFAALFYPGNRASAETLAVKMQEANDRGELVTIVPLNEKGALVSDLIAWPDCPPVPADSPLRYWLPYVGEARPADTQPQAAPVVALSQVLTKKSKRDLLAPEIEAAQRNAPDPHDVAALWLALTARAEKKVKPFIGVTENGLKWSDGNDEPQFLTLKNLRDRINRKPKKAALRLAKAR